MDKTLPDNITISGLRRLRESYKNFLGRFASVYVKLETVHYQDNAGDEVKEIINIWYSDAEEHLHFQSLTEAREHLNKLKKEKSNGDNTSESTSS